MCVCITSYSSYNKGCAASKQAGQRRCKTASHAQGTHRMLTLQPVMRPAPMSTTRSAGGPCVWSSTQQAGRVTAMSG